MGKFVLTDYGKEHRMDARKELETVAHSRGFAKEVIGHFRAGRPVDDKPVFLLDVEEIPGRCWRRS